MAFGVNKEELSDKKEANPETKFIPAGNHLARLVSYIELGKHKPMFKGKPAKYESGKNAGREKPAVDHVALTFEFPLCERTGDYPLTISTTRRMDNGDFFDSVTIPAFLMEDNPRRDMAMKTKFMKFLTRLQEATGKPYSTIAEFAKEQSVVMISVTNKKKDDKVFANMKPEGITSCRVAHPVTKEITDYSGDCPETQGEYCKVFDWEVPTEDAWKALKPWDKKTVKAAVNFEGSAIAALLQANPELDQIENGDADGSEVRDESPSTPAEPTAPGHITDVPPQGDIPV